MASFSSNGVEIAYVDEGQGDPVLLIHGFASNLAANWREPGWIAFLTANGFRTVAYDNRGHGASEKLYDPEAYPARVMAGDAARLLDHLLVARADVIGYSMGARIAAFLAMDHPGRVRSVVFGGLGANMIRGVGGAEPVAAALLAEDPSAIRNENARGFRDFADRTGSDRRALAACIMAPRERITADGLAKLPMPVLVAVGTEDKIAGPAQPLAEVIPGAAILEIGDRDHMKTVGDRRFKEGVLAFLRQRP
jgi:pimeloyl-ACP methyl ester carboxylesterase